MILRKAPPVLVILAMSVCHIHAQNAAKNWIFGQNSRINFNVSPPTSAVVNTINTYEGTSSISDASGNLLFYTDGKTAWDKNDNPMPGGTGLLGDHTSTQTALIVPCSCSKYFIFTTDAFENAYQNGLRYSVVDMSLNGGLGDVVSTSKNISLLPKAAEKIAAVGDMAGGFWVVGHSMINNWFYSYHIAADSNCTLSPQGATTIISKVGSPYAGGSSGYGQGQMKISPDGSKLAVAGLDYGSTSGNNSFVELFKFDRTTGQVTNYGAGGALVRDVSGDSFYGLEFSPNGKELYVTTILNNNKIFQYHVLPTILSPKTLVNNYGGAVGEFHVGQLQLAPDGRIYIARPKSTSGGALLGETYVDALTTPDSGAGGFLSPAVTLASPSQSSFGLPAMVAGDFSCGPTSDGCCDRMTVSPFPNPPLNQDYKTFEIFNFKQPASPICSIDIDMQPAPHTVTWQGGMATWLNSSGISNSLGGSSAPNFVFNYKRLPTTLTIAAVSVPATAPAVKFNLGFDNTQAYNGKTILTVNHCDGTKCVLEYKPWIMTPVAPGTDSGGLLPWSVNIRELSAELLEITLTYQGGRGPIPLPRDGKGAKWVGLRLLNENAEVYSIDGAEISDGRSKKFSLSSSSKTAKAALFEFNGLLILNNREQNGRTITLLIKRKAGSKTEPKQLRLTLYDENANPIITGVPRP